MTTSEEIRNIADRLRATADALEKLAGDQWVDRKTCGISGRAWDRLVTAGLPIVTHGRRKTAMRADVERMLSEERRRVYKPLPPEPVDEIEMLLRNAGLVPGRK